MKLVIECFVNSGFLTFVEKKNSLMNRELASMVANSGSHIKTSKRIGFKVLKHTLNQTLFYNVHNGVLTRRH